MEWVHQAGTPVLWTLLDLSESWSSGIPAHSAKSYSGPQRLPCVCIKKYIYDPKHVINWQDIQVRKYHRQTNQFCR